MVVVDVSGIRLVASRALVVLLGKHSINVNLADPITVPQVVFTATSVKPFTCFSYSCVMAWPAVGGPTIAAVLVFAELFQRLDRLAIGARLVAGGSDHGLPDLPTFTLLAPAVRRATAHGEALSAVRRSTVG
jgi:hypothetical protein